MEEPEVREFEEAKTARPKGQRTSTPVSDAPPKPATIVEGDIIDGRYTVVSFLGEGGMARVFKVERVYFRDVCALKVGNHRVSQRSGQRFQKEAIATRELDHPNLLRVYDFGLIDGEYPYFVMDYLKGTNLAQRLKKMEALPLNEVLSCFSQVCAGMEYAHKKGVVHRDIKPSNIMIVEVDGQNVAKVVDFGLVKLLDETETQGLTKTGEIFGSPLYMSPEQCGGEQIDHRSDIYSFGCAMYECLTGVPPIQGENSMMTMLNHRSEKPQSLKQVTLGKDFPPALERLMEELLAKRPSDRPQSFSEVQMRLDAIAQGREFVSKKKKSRSKIDKPMIIAISLTAVVCLILGVLISSFVAALFAPNTTTGPSTVDVKSAPPERTVEEDLFDKADVHAAARFIPKTDDDVPRFSKIETEKGGERIRVFNFPAGKNLGLLQPTFGHNQKRSWKAEGVVRIPADIPLLLTVGPEALQNPGLLAGFGPDDLDEVSFNRKMVDANVLTHMQAMKGLKALGLELATVPDLGVMFIDEKFPKLEKLDLSTAVVHARAVAKLSRLKQLNLFKLSNVDNGSAVANALRHSNKLHYLSMPQTDLDDADLESISTITCLDSLYIRGNPKITDKGISSLVKCKDLAEVDLKNATLTPASIESFAKMLKLHRLSVTVEEWPAPDRARLGDLMRSRGGYLYMARD